MEALGKQIPKKCKFSGRGGFDYHVQECNEKEQHFLTALLELGEDNNETSVKLMNYASKYLTGPEQVFILGVAKHLSKNNSRAKISAGKEY